jgi:hypothetical protein
VSGFTFRRFLTDDDGATYTTPDLRAVIRAEEHDGYYRYRVERLDGTPTGTDYTRTRTVDGAEHVALELHYAGVL